MGHHPFCDLPGDPSLILTTNVDLGDKKLEIMKGKEICFVVSCCAVWLVIEIVVVCLAVVIPSHDIPSVSYLVSYDSFQLYPRQLWLVPANLRVMLVRELIVDIGTTWSPENEHVTNSHPRLVPLFVSVVIIVFVTYCHCFLAVSINDKADVIFGGSDAPTALGVMYSIGAIGMENNGKLTKAVTEILFDFGVEPNRIYINFFDMPRANVGWSERTFAG